MPQLIRQGYKLPLHDPTLAMVAVSVAVAFFHARKMVCMGPSAVWQFGALYSMAGSQTFELVGGEGALARLEESRDRYAMLT